MKKVNIEKLTESYNQCRIQNLKKSFTYGELHELLESIGFSKNIVSLIIKHGYVVREKIGKNTLYSFQKEPLYKARIEAMYVERRKQANKSYNRQKSQVKNEMDEKAALSILSSKGYKIQRVVGFNLDKFRREQPVMYQRYLEYEEL